MEGDHFQLLLLAVMAVQAAAGRIIPVVPEPQDRLVKDMTAVGAYFLPVAAVAGHLQLVCGHLVPQAGAMAAAERRLLLAEHLLATQVAAAAGAILQRVELRLAAAALAAILG